MPARDRSIAPSWIAKIFAPELLCRKLKYRSRSPYSVNDASAMRMVAGTAGVWANAALAPRKASAPSAQGMALPVMGYLHRHERASAGRR